jgi:hypothetical protein
VPESLQPVPQFVPPFIQQQIKQFPTARLLAAQIAHWLFGTRMGLGLK